MRSTRPIMITGASGQLGMDLQRLLDAQGIPYTAYSKEELDITDLTAVVNRVHRDQPQAIIHAAAYTNVDLAESERDLAYLVNTYGTRNVAVAAEEIGAKLLYVSTDYVFDGRSRKPYNEYAKPSPVNVYGFSKWEGEQLIKQLHRRFFIIRTAWVFSTFGQNFVKTMLKLGGERAELDIVHDQYGCPTYTLDLADTIISMIQSERYGTYHVTNSGSCSWYEFASAIMEEAGLTVKVRSVPTSQFPRSARRPSYSVLEGMALRLNGFQPLRHWREALHDCVQQLQGDRLN